MWRSVGLDPASEAPREAAYQNGGVREAHAGIREVPKGIESAIAVGSVKVAESMECSLGSVMRVAGRPVTGERPDAMIEPSNNRLRRTVLRASAKTERYAEADTTSHRYPISEVP